MSHCSFLLTIGDKRQFSTYSLALRKESSGFAPWAILAAMAELMRQPVPCELLISTALVEIL